MLSILFDARDNKRHWCRPLHDSFDEALDTFIIRDSKYVQQFENNRNNAAPDNINYFKNGYNPIYPNNSLFTNNKQRQQKYKQRGAQTQKKKKKKKKKKKS